MSLIETASADHVTTHYGEFRIHVFREEQGGLEHIALSKGETAGKSLVLCRVASECLTGMVLDAADCDCLHQFRYSLELIDKQGAGIVILLRQEGRGHGLSVKVKALENKNRGHDTFSAVEQLGLPSDRRTYDIAATILSKLQIKSIRLITANPSKATELSRLGIHVSEVIPTPRFVTSRNRRHLDAKVAIGHRFSEDEQIA